MQAVDWLREELAASAKIAESGEAKGRSTVSKRLTHWKADSDLAGVRDGNALSRLREDERKAWQALWTDVDALLKKANNK